MNHYPPSKNSIRNQRKNPVEYPFDREQVSKTVVFIKGIGRYCENPQCNKHIFGRATKRFCSNKCRWKINALRNPPKDALLVHCNINLHKYKTKNEYRIAKIYLKRGVMQEVKITPESKELWALLDKIESFRDIKKPLMELTA